MPDPRLIRSWEITRTHLNRALLALPETIADKGARDALAEYHEYLDHNELGLAFEQLYHVGAMTLVPEEFWQHLRLAADNMGLIDGMERIDQRVRRDPA
jgi:hypothetical protein